MGATIAGLPTMLAIQLRTGWKAAALWVVGVSAAMVGTTSSISGLYDSATKIHGYAEALTAGDALVAVNGKVAGIDSLGGIVANEFGFLAAFALPLMGLTLVARPTRRDEESGCLELLLAGRIGRAAPLVAAVVIATVALVLTSVAFAASLVAIGVPTEGAVAYAASLGSLGFVFAGVAALGAQVVEHARTVRGVGLGVLVVAYLVRGVADVRGSELVWASPLGWQEQVRAFGATRWWPLLVPLVAGAALAAAAVALAARRDLTSALFHRAGANPRASSALRRPVGLAVHTHRGSIIGWAVGAVVVSGVFGALTQQVSDALVGNPALGTAFGGPGTSASSVDSFLSMTVLLLVLLCAGYGIQGASALRAEEVSGRLESTLAGTTARSRWLALQIGVILAGAVVVAALGALALAVGATWSTGDRGQGLRLLLAVTAYAPAILVLAAVPVALFGVAPRLQPLGWTFFAVTTLVAFLATPLGLPAWVAGLAPTGHVGFVPLEVADTWGLWELTAVAVGLLALALAGFVRRGIPRG